MKEHIDIFTDLIKKIDYHQLGHQQMLVSETINAAFVRSLSKNYQTYIEGLGLKIYEMTTEALYADILGVEQTRIINNINHGSEPEIMAVTPLHKAMFSNHQQLRQKFHPKRRFIPYNKDRFQSPSNLNSNHDRLLKFYNYYKKNGYTIDECYKKNKSNSNSIYFNNTSDLTSSNPERLKWCNYCKKNGHIMDECLKCQYINSQLPLHNGDEK